jgi:hypothetical protein
MGVLVQKLLDAFVHEEVLFVFINVPSSIISINDDAFDRCDDVMDYQLHEHSNCSTLVLTWI